MRAVVGVRADERDRPGRRTPRRDHEVGREAHDLAGARRGVDQRRRRSPRATSSFTVGGVASCVAADRGEEPRRRRPRAPRARRGGWRGARWWPSARRAVGLRGEQRVGERAGRRARASRAERRDGRVADGARAAPPRRAGGRGGTPRGSAVRSPRPTASRTRRRPTQPPTRRPRAPARAGEPATSSRGTAPRSSITSGRDRRRRVAPRRRARDARCAGCANGARRRRRRARRRRRPSRAVPPRAARSGRPAGARAGARTRIRARRARRPPSRTDRASASAAPAYTLKAPRAGTRSEAADRREPWRRTTVSARHAPGASEDVAPLELLAVGPDQVRRDAGDGTRARPPSRWVWSQRIRATCRSGASSTSSPTARQSPSSVPGHHGPGAGDREDPVDEQPRPRRRRRARRRREHRVERGDEVVDRPRRSCALTGTTGASVEGRPGDPLAHLVGRRSRASRRRRGRAS